jgi:hypothetical protein
MSHTTFRMRSFFLAAFHILGNGLKIMDVLNLLETDLVQVGNNYLGVRHLFPLCLQVLRRLSKVKNGVVLACSGTFEASIDLMSM